MLFLVGLIGALLGGAAGGFGGAVVGALLGPALLMLYRQSKKSEATAAPAMPEDLAEVPLVALARREADAKKALASAQLLDARAQVDAAIAARRTERAEIAAELEATRQKQRAAESALAEATADSAHLVLRAPAPAIVTELAVRPGDRAVTGAPLLKLERVP
jgi:multidrug resistance efflux pump